jgi:hypothetical protein
MAGTVLDVVRGAFGTDDYAVIADRAASGAADRQVRELLDGWRQWAFDWAEPETPPHALRPYVLAHWKGDPGSGLAGLWQQGAGAGTSGVLREQFLRHLLYCDAIALPDPLFGQAALTPILGQVPELSFIELERYSVAEVITRLAPFTRLIETGVLMIVPYTDEPDLPTYLISDLTQVADTLSGEFPQMPADWVGEITYAQRAAIDIGAQIITGRGDFDAYLPSAAHVHLFRALCGSANSVLREVSGSPLPENRLFWHLLDCELPDLAQLPDKEVVAIRRDGQFEAWRRAVTDGLLRVEALTGHDDDWPGLAEADRHEIAASVQAAAKAAGPGKHWSAGKKVEATISIAAVGGSIAAPLLAPAIAAALAGIGALGVLCHALVWWRNSRPGAFARHVAVFGDGVK